MTRKSSQVLLGRDRWSAIGHHALSAPVWPNVARLALLCVGVVLAGDTLCHLIAESLWFSELGYEQVFISQITARVGLWIVALGSTGCLLVFNLRLARQRQYHEPVILPPERTTLPALVRYLIVIIGLSLLMVCVLIQVGQTASQFWQPSLVASRSEALQQFSLASFAALLKGARLWQWMLAGGFIGWLIANPGLVFAGISIGLSLSMGLIFSSHWTQVLAVSQATNFHQVDPLFGRDVAFYIFALPVLELLRFWAMAVALTSLLGVLLIYLLSGNSLSQGGMPDFSLRQQRHLYGLSAGLMFILAAGLWLDRFQLLYSTQGVLFGAGFTDSHIDLPARTLLSWGGVAIALLLTYRTCFWTRSRSCNDLLLLLGCYMGSVLLGAVILPQIVQSVIVQPNELRREQPYIKQSIALTRKAFDLGSVETQTFNPTADLTPERLKANDITIRNIRLWDTRPLLEANRQLQRIRLYYEFPDADIDRYTLKTESTSTTATEKRQVFVSARELDYSAVPQKAQTWVNRHLIYTHGYGFTMSPINIAQPSGLPTYFVKDIGTEADAGTLPTATDEIRASIPTERPRIYYGELTTNYVMTGTHGTDKELDYPSGNDNIYNTYDGSGGIAMHSFWRRGIFATYLKDWRILFSHNFADETRVLFRRQIETRVHTIAPFLKLDREPYLVAANGIPPRHSAQQPSTLYWMIDAYTTSYLFPYSDPGEESFNYIRNSVKVVVDAYNGDVTFYSVDETDPILRTWQQVFPDLFQPFNAMPSMLQSHIRYPVDLFRVQSHSLLTYHMTDPQVFYNREDQWRIPNEIYGGKSQPVEPYYLTMKLPGAESEEFVLLSPFTPVGRNNLIAWMAARSDGDSYGKRLLYQFPKRELVFGPEQIEALINQDPIISQQISLWDTQGSQAIQGNLLIVPIDNSLLYVEPLYLEAEETSVPILARVIVVYENQIVMAKTLNQALNSIFSPSEESADVIIRPVEAPLPLRQGDG
jgi:uncharacterized protein